MQDEFNLARPAYKGYDALVGPNEQFGTLGQALSVAKDGWKILILGETYELGSYTCPRQNITIEGVSREQSKVNLITGTIQFTAPNITIKNFSVIYGKTGILKFTNTSANLVVQDINMAVVAVNDATCFDCLSSFANVSGIHFEWQVNSDPTTNVILISGASSSISNCTFDMKARCGGYFLTMSGNNSVLTNCNFITTSDQNGSFIYTTGYYQTISNCTFQQNNGGSFSAVYIMGIYNTISGCYIGLCRRGLFINGTNNTVIGCTFVMSSFCNGIYSGGTAWDGCIFTDNKFISDTTSNTTGIYNVAGYTNVGQVIANNHFKTLGIGFTLGTSADNVDIRGNTFDGCSNQISQTGKICNIQNCIGLDDSKNKEIRYFKNTSGGALAEGDAVIIKAVSASNEITTTTVAGDNNIWGICLQAISNNAFGYICVGGLCTAKVDGTNDIAIGEKLSAFTTAKILQKAGAGHTAIAIALATYTTDDSNGVIACRVITPRQV